MKENHALNTGDNNLNGFWKKVLGILQTELNPMAFNTWVIKVRPENLSDDSIDLVAAMPYIQKQLQKYTSLIEDAIFKVAKKKIKVNYVIKNITEEKKEDEIPLPGPLFESQKQPRVDERVIQKAGLFPKFTFESFIMGNSNQLAYAIAQAVAENPGQTYNPYFLYAGVGLGKTHLMQAIGNRILQKTPKTNVIYTTGEAFMNELIETIQSGKGRGKYTSNEFRNKYRKADVLLIDDIQFIIGRETTQLEFFHTFNTLYMAGKQIVLTSDRPPKDFVNLEKRITSRFGSGIIADIQQPDADLRNAILRTKRDLNKDPIGNDVIDFIAQQVESNIRELEGAYLQVLTMAKTSGQRATVGMAELALGNSISLNKNKNINSNDILKAVCKYYSVKASDIKGARRTKELVIPRQIVMYLIKEMTNAPLMGIGEFLGGRDHTTVMHGIRKMEEEVNGSGKIKQDIVNVKKMI